MQDDDAAGYHYHLFVSYTRTPDGELAREMERFLEGFHAALPTAASGPSLQPLRVCVDGSDFNLPPPDADTRADGQRRDVLNVVFEHLARSRELLVLCSRHAARTRWVEEEVRWFIEQRGAGSVRLAFTEGDDQGADPEQWFPATVRAAGLTGNIAYDLRGYDERRARDWRQVADFNRELVRLAADLNGVSGGDLYPTWLEGELARARTQSLELATSARFETLAGDPTRALLKAVEAHEIHPAPETENALRDACRVAVLHHYNRRETATLTGAGPGYLASRWKQGEVFVRTSPDGRYRVLVTARGKDGPKPAGDVYLVSNESQRVVELAAPERSRRRVEEVAFSDDSRRVLVTRYFDLTIYGLDGEILGEYAFSRHTKSPVHLLAGPFCERYLIGAETKGGVWLVDPEVGKAATVCVLREWHGDASLAAAIAPGGRRAALVFESGRVSLLALDDAGEAVLVDVPHPGTLYAGWLAGREDRLITAGGDGVVRLWDSRTTPPALLLASDPVAPAIDWVVASDDGRRLCAVGADRRLYLLDSEHGRHLATLDHDADIDWEALRVVRLSAEPPPLPLLEPQVTMAWPDDSLVVTDSIVLGEQAWCITKEPGDGEYALPIHKAWRIENDIACLYATHVSGITRHADMLWLHSSFGNGGTLFWIDGERLRRFPNEPVSVRVLLIEGDVVWVGSERGGYRHQGSDHRLATPADASVNLIERIDGRLWFATTAGAFVVEDTRTLQVSEPFVNVTALRHAAGHTWLLTRADSGGFLSSNGPAYLVDGCFARALPASRAPVGNVLEAAGHAWLCTEHALHRFDGTWLRTIEGLERPVSTLVEDGDTLVATTASWGLFPSAGPVYRIDPERLTLTVVDDAAGQGAEPAAG